ncbi:MAG: glutamyl-tRNA reductase [Ignavibacteriaceae bacterium]|nr:glutamyl-tRNA reductase [Ignavibacteriaceae bacterium]
MNLLSISINHRTAPVEIRESMHLSSEEIKQFVRDLKGSFFNEGVIISTCNRTEIYGIPVNNDVSFSDIRNFLIQRKPNEKISAENFQNFISRDSMRQLFRVITGIDSMLIGDNQIFKQVKDSFTLAEEMQFVGFLMRRVFDSAIKTGKRAITETAISEGAVTVSYAAVQLIEKVFSNLNKKSALVIGAGETGEIAAKNLIDKNIGRLNVTNRTLERAERLASELNARAIPFERFKDHLHEFDIIISATSSEDLLLSKKEIEAAMKKRNYASMVLMDIAIPRDIDPATKKIDYVFYHDIDSLNIIVEQNLAKRRSEIPKVEAIIESELDSFFNWYNSLQVAPTIKSLRDYFENIRAEEIEKNLNRFSSEDREKIEIITKKIMNKILHQPTVELKKTAESGISPEESASRIGIIRSLFGIDSSEKNNPE